MKDWTDRRNRLVVRAEAVILKKLEEMKDNREASRS